MEDIVLPTIWEFPKTLGGIFPNHKFYATENEMRLENVNR
jgi:hypothetical protein